MTEPTRKIDVVRAAMAGGDWSAAIRAAAKFADLGVERDAILSAREALLRSAFQRQLGRDPQALIEAGKAALIRRYGNE